MTDPIGRRLETGLTTLQTVRLTMRRFCEDDGETVDRLLNDREIASNTRSIPFPFPPGQGKVRIQEQKSKWETGEAYVFGICLRETGELIGGVGLEVEPEHHHAELGYWVGREYWSRGYCSEAAVPVIEFGFEQIGLHRIHAHHLTRNPASGRVLEKVGMLKEGLLRGHSRKWGVFEDIVFYGMLTTDPRKGSHGSSGASIGGKIG